MKKLGILVIVLFFCSMAFAAASSPVTVNSISCTSGVCTVTTAAAHNIPTSGNEVGFCLQSGPAADVLCGTAATVPSTTTFTVSSATMATCASSCGTAQPAKNFLVLGDPITNNQGLQILAVCVWTYTPTPLPSPNRVSVCSQAEPNATLLSAENGALASGAWNETVLNLTFSSSDSRAQIEQELQRMQLSMQNAMSAGIQPGRDSGTFCDVVGCNQ